MKIKELYIENYRNLSGLTIRFDSITNFVIGNNGIGKSNLMELVDTIFNRNSFKEKDCYSSRNQQSRVYFNY